MSKRDITMIIVTVILVGLMVAGFIYDRTPALLDRTNPYAFSEDENIKIIATEKKGFTFRRVYYEAKLQILDNYWEAYYARIAELTDNPGMLMNKTSYLDYERQVLTNAVLKPVPSDNAVIWLCGIEYEDSAVVYIIDQENDANSYIYIYYSRK